MIDVGDTPGPGRFHLGKCCIGVADVGADAQGPARPDKSFGAGQLRRDGRPVDAGTEREIFEILFGPRRADWFSRMTASSFLGEVWPVEVSAENARAAGARGAVARSRFRSD